MKSLIAAKRKLKGVKRSRLLGVNGRRFWLTALMMAAVIWGAAGEGKQPTIPFLVVGCVETHKPPTIDGRLTEPVWKQAGIASRFVLLNTTQPATEQTTVYLLHDTANLYIGFRCLESQREGIIAAVTERDGPVYTDDSVEVFLIPPNNHLLNRFPQRERYFHLIVNTRSVQYDEVGYNNPAGWDGKWQAAAFMGEGCWELEMAVPFPTLDAQPQGIWAVNFNRGQKRLGENSSWSPVYGSFHDPEHFGRMVFVKRTEQAKELERQAEQLQARALRDGRLLPNLKGIEREVAKASSFLRSLRSPLKEFRLAKTRLREIAKRLASLRHKTTSLSAPLLLQHWEDLDRDIAHLETEVRAVSNEVLVFRSFTPSQLQGKEPLPSFSVFVTPAITNEKVLPDRLPPNAQPSRTLSLFACPEEYEPATFTVYALRDLKAVSVTVSRLHPSSLVTRHSPLVDVRVVKCWYQAGVQVWETKQRLLTPELLLKDDDLVRVDHERRENFLKVVDASGTVRYVPISTPTSEHLVDLQVNDNKDLQPVDIPARTLKQFWLTVYVPKGTAPGDYVGTVHIQPKNAPAAKLKLKVKVLPFSLEKPLLRYSIYYRGVLTADGKGSISSEAKSPKQYFAEMLNLKEHGVEYPTIYQGFDPVLLKQALGLRAKAGLPKGSLYTLGISAGTQQKPEELEALKASVKQWLDFLRPLGYSELYIYAIDEASGETLSKERPAFRAVHEAGAKIFVACYRDFWERVGDLLDLPIWSGAPDPEMAKKVHSVGNKIWNYGNPQVGNEEPETYRRNFGLRLWKANYDGACDYAYQHSFHHIWNDFDDPHYRDHVFAYPTVDGVIDTMQWEGFREGVDDVRYLTTLLKAIEKAKGEGGRKGKLAKEAEAWLRDLDINGNLDAVRQKMVKFILRLKGKI